MSSKPTNVLFILSDEHTRDVTGCYAQAFADQKAKIERFGGVEVLIARGDFGYSPAPGEKPVFATTLEA